MILLALCLGMVFMKLSEWPGLNIDAALFTSPALSLANDEGWKFHGYLYRLTKVLDGTYSSHSILYPLVFGLIFRASTYEAILFWSAAINSFLFLAYFFAPFLILKQGISWWKFFWSLLLGITAGVIGLFLQGRPEQLVPVILLVPLLIARDGLVSRPNGFLILSGVHSATATMLGLLSPLTAVVYVAAVMGWTCISLQSFPQRPTLIRMIIVAMATALGILLVVFSFCDFSLTGWLLNTFKYGSSDPNSKLLGRLTNFFALNISLDLPMWNVPVMLSFLLMLAILFKRRQYLVLVLVALCFSLVIRSAQSYVYVGFVPGILLCASFSIIPEVRQGVLARSASIGARLYASSYGLVFARHVILFLIYSSNGLSFSDARSQLRMLTNDLLPDSEVIAYFWMRRPSFVVMNDQSKSWVTAEMSIYDGNEQTLALYEKQSGKTVKYFVYPQLGHIQTPPKMFQNGTKRYRLVYNGWTNKRAEVAGFRLGGELPGYNFALYKLVGT